MILLALDTCDARGGLAILRDHELVHTVAHKEPGDYSSWVLPATQEALAAAGVQMPQVDLYAVASGPGSFTGVRVALTTAKAWSEAYGKSIAAVSRLEAMASQADGQAEYVAAFVDAHREQVYGGLYRRQAGGLVQADPDMVVTPADFLERVRLRSGNARVDWISLDPEKLTAHAGWRIHADAGETVQASPGVLAPAIGGIGLQRAADGRLTDALALDADYIRRPDAEVNWKPGVLRASST